MSGNKGYFNLDETLICTALVKMRKNSSTAVATAESALFSRLSKFVLLTGYPIEDVKYFRKAGPPTDTQVQPPRGSEVFIKRLPSDVFEDEIYYFFCKAGVIYDIRLMVRPSGLANRGFAFVRYFTPEDAQKAIVLLDGIDIRPNHKIVVRPSAENNRLFLSGVPLNKTKSEIWSELERKEVRNVCDVIVYKSYYKDKSNRGFVFVEFNTHEDAATTRRKFAKGRKLVLWDTPVQLDWSKPLLDADPAVMATVTRIFIRNLKISMTKGELIGLLQSILDITMIDKIYKKKNYSFIHFHTREMAEEGLEKLRDHFCGTDVEVTWSIPPSEAKKREENLPFRFKKDQKTKPIKCNCKHSKPVVICPCVNRHCEVTTPLVKSSINSPVKSEGSNAESKDSTRSQQVRALWIEENRHWFDVSDDSMATDENGNKTIPLEAVKEQENTRWFYNRDRQNQILDVSLDFWRPLPQSNGRMSFINDKGSTTSSEDKSRMAHSSSSSINDAFHFDLPEKCIGNIFE